MQDALLRTQHREGATEDNIRQVEGLIGLFTKLQVDGRKQKTLAGRDGLLRAEVTMSRYYRYFVGTHVFWPNCFFIFLSSKGSNTALLGSAFLGVS